MQEYSFPNLILCTVGALLLLFVLSPFLDDKLIIIIGLVLFAGFHFYSKQNYSNATSEKVEDLASRDAFVLGARLSVFSEESRKNKIGEVKLTLDALDLKVKRGDVPAMETLALFYQNIEDFKSSFSFATQAEKKGSASAKSILGSYHLYGIVVDKNVRRGLALIEQSAKDGYSFAYWTLYNIYINGEFVAIDAQKALDYLRSGVALKDKRCIEEMGKRNISS